MEEPLLPLAQRGEWAPFEYLKSRLAAIFGTRETDEDKLSEQRIKPKVSPEPHIDKVRDRPSVLSARWELA
jgi:hypothetical protein